mgnify:CR=1 FL=1
MDSRKFAPYFVLSSLLITGLLIAVLYFIQFLDETLGFVSFGQFLLWIDSLNWWESTAVWLSFWFTTLYTLRFVIQALQKVLARKRIRTP